MHPRDSDTGIINRPSTKPAVVMLMGAWEDGFRAGWSEAYKDMGWDERVSKMMPASAPLRVQRKKKRVGKKDPKMARALRKANSMGRKKSGGFKKGWSQGKIMKKAHQLRRKMR